MTDNRNLFHRCLHVFRHLDDSRQRRVALHDAREKLIENPLDLAINQVVDLKLIKPPCLLQLPGARAANNNLGVIFLNDWMSDNLKELSRVQGCQIFAEKFGVNIGSVGDA